VKKFLCALVVFGAVAARGADYGVVTVKSLDMGPLESRGQVQNPLRSPGGEAIAFEFLGAEGDSLGVYVAEAEPGDGGIPKLNQPTAAMGNMKQDVFSLGGPEDKPVSEQEVWGPSTKRGTQLVFAATRRESSRGGAEVNYDLMYATKGKRRFLTDHPENDSSPAFSPNGEHLAFVSGRSGEGDIYIYSFYREDAQLIRLTFEESGSELSPVWSPDGKSLAFVGHLGGADHLLVIDDPLTVSEVREEAARMALLRTKTRDLTPGSQNSSFAPSFSPDGKWIAYYVHVKGELKSDLYLVPAGGGEARRLRGDVLPGARLGPAWSPESDGVFVVDENAQEMNPIEWVPIARGGEARRLETGTELNTDVTAWKTGDSTYLLFAAQGGSSGEKEKRWRKLFAAQLKRN